MVPLKAFLDKPVHRIINVLRTNRRTHLLKGMEDQLAVDQILQRVLLDLFDFGFQSLGRHRPPRLHHQDLHLHRRRVAHLGLRDRTVVHRSDQTIHLRGIIAPSWTGQKGQQGENRKRQTTALRNPRLPGFAGGPVEGQTHGQGGRDRKSDGARAAYSWLSVPDTRHPSTQGVNESEAPGQGGRASALPLQNSDAFAGHHRSSQKMTATTGCGPGCPHLPHHHPDHAGPVAGEFHGAPSFR